MRIHEHQTLIWDDTVNVCGRGIDETMFKYMHLRGLKRRFDLETFKVPPDPFIWNLPQFNLTIQELLYYESSIS